MLLYCSCDQRWRVRVKNPEPFLRYVFLVATSFPQTEEIIENGKVSGMTATDVQKILNLKS